MDCLGKSQPFFPRPSLGRIPSRSLPLPPLPSPCPLSVPLCPPPASSCPCALFGLWRPSLRVNSLTCSPTPPVHTTKWKKTKRNTKHKIAHKHKTSGQGHTQKHRRPPWYGRSCLPSCTHTRRASAIGTSSSRTSCGSRRPTTPKSRCDSRVVWLGVHVLMCARVHVGNVFRLGVFW